MYGYLPFQVTQLLIILPFLKLLFCYQQCIKSITFADTQRALQAVERLQTKLKERGDAFNEEKLSLLKTVLQSSLFHQIINLQSSVQQLKDQVGLKRVFIT
ncbi:MPDZ protein, partial [Polyodon spathula]|nr:MPDZ protein [Polyodon spathula]